MGTLQSSPAPSEYADLSEKTGFSFEQIGVLHKRFRHLSHDEDVLRFCVFSCEIKYTICNASAFLLPPTIQEGGLQWNPDLASNPIRTQIVEAFFDRRNFSKDGEGKVDEIGFEEFLVVMSHFRPPSWHMTEEQRESVRKEKLRFLFNMHDSDNDGIITLEEYRHVVEELLSRSGALGKETAKSIADAAMLEVASISVGHMEPDEFYEGITFDHFLKLLATFEIESKMSVRFLNMDTIALCK